MMANSWKIGKFKEVLEPVSRPVAVEPDKIYRTLGVQWYAKGLFIREEKPGYDIRAKVLYSVENGDFVYNRLFAWKGSFGIADADTEGGVVSGEFPCFRVKVERADAKFLHYYLSQEWVWDEIGRNSTGQTNISRLRLKEKDFLAMEVPLPPLDEQRRIVARIETLAGRIAEAQSLRQSAVEEAEKLIASAQRSIFDNKKKLSWEKKKLREIGTVARGKFSHRPRNEPRFYGGDIPFIQIGDISSSNRFIQNYSQTLNEDGLKISRLFPKGTIVIAITGATIGVTGILDIDACFPDSIVGIVPESESILPLYVYWALEHTKQVALEQATQTTQPNINLRILDTITIPVPLLDEQRRIVAYLDGLSKRVNELRRLQAESQVELDALLPSVLDRAFKGEL